MSNDIEYKYDNLLKAIHEKILPLLEKAILEDNITFQNPNLKVCWKIKNCGKTDCPVYNKEDNLRCWQVAGTYCGGKVQGVFAEKYKNCKSCEIYKSACPTALEELEEGFNNLLFLISKQRKYSERQIKEINYLNKELSSTLENLDNRNRAIQELVITDKLTGLFNRNYLFTVLEDEFSRAQRYNTNFSVLMIDIDNFKKVNDELGHLIGDKLLSSLGDLINKTLRKTDRAFRYGGEEFVIILPETEITIANIVANRIREAFQNNILTIDENSKKIEVSRTLSVGVTSYQKGSNIQGLLKQADEAMYTAKAQGKNKVIRYDLLV